MSDNLKIKQPQDPNRINIHQDWELTYWANKFGISQARLITVVKLVGVMVEDVKKHLNK